MTTGSASQLFLKTLEDYELLDTAISAESVLWRLFHEDEVRVHPSQALRFECSCSAENIRSVLGAYPAEELKDLPDPDGVIRTRCEFCATVYEFPLATLRAVVTARRVAPPGAGTRRRPRADPVPTNSSALCA